MLQNFEMDNDEKFEHNSYNPSLTNYAWLKQHKSLHLLSCGTVNHHRAQPDFPYSVHVYYVQYKSNGDP